MFQTFLQPSEVELGDSHLEALQKQLKQSIEKAKSLVLSCKVGRYEQSEFKVDSLGHLILPEYILHINYNEEFWKKYLKNQVNFAIIKELSEKIEQLQRQVKEVDALSQEYQKLYKIKNRKKNRRLAIEIEKSFECPYDDCYRIYGSDVSLNLHIKLKHGGGNKTDRQQLAEQICLAELKGKAIPDMHFNLPKDFLENYRTSFLDKHENGQDGNWFEQKKKQLIKVVHFDQSE